MTCVKAIKSLHHSGAILKTAPLPEDTSTMVASMLPAIRESPFPWDFSSTQNNFGNRSSLISTFSYATATDHPWSSSSVTQPDLPYVHNVERPPAWRLGIEVGFSTCNPNNQTPTITVITINSHMKIILLCISLEHPIPPYALHFSTNNPSQWEKGMDFD